MPALTLTAAEQAGVSAADTALDASLTSGMINPDTSANTDALAGYAMAAVGGTPATDKRPLVRGPWKMAWVALTRALSTFVEPVTLVSPFLNSWVNFDVSISNAAGYYKDLTGRVWLQGRVKSGVVGSPIFTLPAGYRPPLTVQYAVDSNGAHGTLKVEPSGDVTLAVGTNVSASLEGVSFRV